MLFKKIIACLCAFAFLVLPTMCAEAASKPIVAVIPFTDQSARKSASNQEAIDNAWDYVENAIRQTNRFRTMTRTQIDKLVDELKLDNESGLIDPSTAAKYGKMIGAQYLILGTVTGLGNKSSDTVAHLSLRMIEVETAEIYLSGRGKGKAKDSFDALEKAAKDALNGEMGMLTMLRGGKK